MLGSELSTSFVPPLHNDLLMWPPEETAKQTRTDSGNAESPLGRPDIVERWGGGWGVERSWQRKPFTSAPWGQGLQVRLWGTMNSHLHPGVPG